MEQRLTDELLHARRSFRKIAAQLLVVINKTSAPCASDRAEIKRQFPEVYRECHAIADLADQWLRSGQIPTADEWASLTQRVHRISAIIDLWDEQATPDGSPLPLAR
jgi:hypothetical protein